MSFAGLWLIFSLSFIMSLSGALMPGPMLTYTIAGTVKAGPGVGCSASPASSWSTSGTSPAAFPPRNGWPICATASTRSIVPIAFITGQTGKNVKAMLNHAQMLFRQSHNRVATRQLNKLVRAALEQNEPPLVHNRRPKVYYATQVASQPPTIVLFCNDPKSLSLQYQHYLLHVFRDELKFGEVPIKLYLRRREHGDERDEIDARNED